MAGQYDFEEQERIAELRAWWEDNRWFVIGTVAAAILAIGGYRGWIAWDARQADDAAAMFTPVADAAKGGDPKKVAEAVKPLIDKHAGSFPASEAALIGAKAAFEAGNYAEARRYLEWTMKNGVEAHRGIARMRLAAVLLEEKKFDEALRTLDGNEDPAFAAMAADLKGDVMLAQGRFDEARAAYKLAAEKADANNPVKGIAETKLRAMGGAQ